MPLIDPDAIFFSKRLASVAQLESGEYCLSFADGTTYNADLVIGADGIRSTVRDAVLYPTDSNRERLVFTNRHIYRGMISVETLRAAGVTQDIFSHSMSWLGFGKVRKHQWFFEQQSMNTKAD